MTPEQAAKLRKGDRILVEMVVEDRGFGSFVGAYMPRLRAMKPVNVDPADIHSILPRPLEAGDRVVAVDDPVSGEIIIICGDEGWVRWPAGDTSVEPLSDLRRVEDQ